MGSFALYLRAPFFLSWKILWQFACLTFRFKLFSKEDYNESNIFSSISYINSLARNISDPCPAGKYRSDDQAECQDCKKNHFSSERAASCALCEVGHVANDGKTQCGMSNTCSWQKLNLALIGDLYLSNSILKN